MKIKAEVEIFDDEIYCEDRYNCCQFLKNQWCFCTLFKEKLKVDSDVIEIGIDLITRTTSIKCIECKKSYQELTPYDLHDDILKDHL